MPRNALRAISFAMAVIGASCGDVQATALSSGAPMLEPAAAERCKADLPNVVGYGRVDALTGAFDVAAGEFAQWDETRNGPGGPGGTSRWRTLPSAERLTICFYDGSFGFFPRPRVEPEPAPYERIVVVLQTNGTHTFVVAGYRSTLPVRRPGTP